ncbi:hypothetical protein BGW39_010768 [Mortierella sp. 14UC]|nr:hypothetical protein BGW39_010768 [Mortierella sp. 14UC]
MVSANNRSISIDTITKPNKRNNKRTLTNSSTTTTTSVDLSTLITAPTKVHIDHMGTDERSKILASLQLAIERAQAYRDELLDKDREDLRGSRTGGTQGQGAYFQQEQQQMEHGYYQDASYLGNNMNEAKHHQRQRQYQNHNNNSQNQDHQQHQHYNDLHNNMHPYFQNHHYHPPLSPGPGTAATCMSAPSYSSHYNPHQHALDEKSSDRITFVVMYLLGLIVPIYALVDFGITRSQRLRDTAASAAASVAAAMAVTSGGGGGTNSSNNASLAIKNNNSATAASTNTSSSASASTETKNRDEEAFHTGAFIHHI